MNQLLRVIVIVVAAAVSLSSHVAADEEIEQPDFVNNSRLTVRITSGVWFPRLSGGGALDGAGSVDFIDDVDLHDSEPTFNGEVDFRFKRWQLRVELFDFSTDRFGPAGGEVDFGAVQAKRGEIVRGAFDQTMLGIELGYGLRPIEEDELLFRFRPVIALRYVDVDMVLEAPLQAGSPRQSASLDTLIVQGGVRLEVAWSDTLFVRSGVAFGSSSDGGFISSVTADVTWYPDSGPLGLSFGYRLFYMNGLEGDDEFELDSRLAGIFFGGSVRF